MIHHEARYIRKNPHLRGLWGVLLLTDFYNWWPLCESNTVPTLSLIHILRVLYPATKGLLRTFNCEGSPTAVNGIDPLATTVHRVLNNGNGSRSSRKYFTNYYSIIRLLRPCDDAPWNQLIQDQQASRHRFLVQEPELQLSLIHI